jgi:hypothetical protein
LTFVAGCYIVTSWAVQSFSKPWLLNQGFVPCHKWRVPKKNGYVADIFFYLEICLLYSVSACTGADSFVESRGEPYFYLFIFDVEKRA